MQKIDDGYIKFTCNNTVCDTESLSIFQNAENVETFKKLDTFRTAVYDQNFIGLYENGIGYGNLSHRMGNSFLITASATGGARELGIDGYTLVTSVDIEKNTVVSQGSLPASSETMTHAGIYINAPKVQCVLHIHNQRIFDALIEKNALSTDSNIPYGTVEMAKALEKIAISHPLEATIVMKGHQEGVLIYGTSIEHVSSQLQFLCLEVKQNHCNKCKKGAKDD